MKFLIFLISTLAACSAQTAPLIIAKMQGWSIVKTTDSMSDVTTCRAVFNKYPVVILSKERIAIFMKDHGGVDAYQFRFDKESASSFAPRMPTDSPDLWWSGDMDRILGATRLQVRIRPIIGHISDFDIDLRPAKAIHSILTSDRCK